MKNINVLLVFISIFLLFSANAQERKFEFMVGYGLLQSDFRSTLSFASPFENDYETPSIGPRVEFSLDYKLKDNKFIGIGYAQHSSSIRITDNALFESLQIIETPTVIELLPVENGIATLLSFDNYRLRREVRHYNVHFRKKFQSGINLTIGAFFYQHFETYTFVTFSESQEAINIRFNETTGRADDFGAFGALDYTFLINNHIEIGVRGQVFYSFIGVESLTFAPIVRISL
jgi:hypothetical protein